MASPTPKPHLSFPQAMEAVIDGFKITKQEWGDELYFGELRDGFLMIHKPGWTYHQWIVSEADMKGDDWYVLTA